jgi:hypothetical protein
MFIRGNSTAADGDAYYAQGAITFDPAPNGFSFDTQGAHNVFVANFTRQIPAGGSLTIQQTYSIGSTQAAVAALAAQAEDQMDTPAVSIGSPADGTTVATPTVTVTGKATDQTISSLTVNGQPVPVAADGSFSAPVSLTPGPNTITATATDGAGNQGHASVTVNYRPVTNAPQRPPAASPTLAPIGGLNTSGSVGFSLVCRAAAGAVCHVFARLTTFEKLLGTRITAVSATARKRHSRLVIIGSRSASVPAGRSVAVTVPLNGTGRRLLAQFKRLPAMLKITLLDTKPQEP